MKKVGDPIIAVKVVVEQDTFKVISACAPSVELAENFKVKFWEDLEVLFQDISQEDKLILGGDLDEHLGSVARGFKRVHEGYSIGEVNAEGKYILEYS